MSPLPRPTVFLGTLFRLSNVSGEDGEIFERVLAAGLKVVFLGRARVHHKVESFGLTKRYLRRWWFQTSRCLAVTKGVPGSKRMFNIPLYLFGHVLRAAFRVIGGYLSQPSDVAFHRELIMCHFLGTLDGLWQSRTRILSSQHGP